jgi:isoleucyl-tRNA synthetase
MFQPVTSKVNFPQLEEKILGLWKQNQIFERSVEARQGATRFTLYEGPPTAARAFTMCWRVSSRTLSPATR